MDKAMWEKAVAFHGHECPGLALGVRLCEFVRLRLGRTSAHDEELVCIAETDACPGDAIQALLGCTCTSKRKVLVIRPAMQFRLCWAVLWARGILSTTALEKPPIPSLTVPLVKVSG